MHSSRTIREIAFLTAFSPVLAPPECGQNEDKSFESGEFVHPRLELVCSLRRGRNTHHEVNDLSWEEQLNDAKDRQNDAKHHTLNVDPRQQVTSDVSPSSGNECDDIRTTLCVLCPLSSSRLFE